MRIVHIPSPTFGKRAKVDQFSTLDFFKDSSGMRLNDYNVFARSAADPELQAKIREHMLETEVSGYDSSVTDDEILSQLMSKYESADTLLERVISKVRSLPEEKPEEI